MNWLRWGDEIGERDQAFFDFLRKVIALRLGQPLLRQRYFLHGEPRPNGASGVRWLRADGEQMGDEDWHQPHTRAFAMLLFSDTQKLLIVFNAHYEDIEFSLPEGFASGWRRLLDTADPAAAGDRVEGPFSASSRTLMMLETTA